MVVAQAKVVCWLVSLSEHKHFVCVCVWFFNLKKIQLEDILIMIMWVCEVLNLALDIFFFFFSKLAGSDVLLQVIVRKMCKNIVLQILPSEIQLHPWMMLIYL